MTHRPPSPPRFNADLISLRALVAIADTGSFSAAAERIGRTQSAVSLQIARLEERLGARLLQRNSRSVVTTVAGNTMIAYARRVLALTDETVQVVSQCATSPAMRVGIDDFHDRAGLLAALRQFQARYPQATLTLSFQPVSVLRQSLQTGELDALIGHSPVDTALDTSPGSCTRTRLLQEPLVWVSNGDRFSSTRNGDGPIPIVLPDACSGLRTIVLEALNKSDQRWQILSECNTVAAVQCAVRAGLGVAALPLSALGQDLVEADLMLPALPASALCVELPRQERHPQADELAQLLASQCSASLEGLISPQPHPPESVALRAHPP